MSTTTIKMPQLGETVTEGTITRWLKKVGDKIEKYEAFAEVATDKVNAEIPSPTAGVLLEILVGEGETVPTGSAIASIGLPEGAVAESTPAAAPSGSMHDAAASMATAASAAAPAPEPASAGHSTARASEPSAAVSLSEFNALDMHGQRLSPAVRRALREHLLDPAKIQGTGHDGRVTLADVARAAANGGARGSSHAADGQNGSPGGRQSTGQVKRVPLTRARKTIADHMVKASNTIPHAWTMVEVDVSRLVAKRTAERDRMRAKLGFVPTYFHYFSHAVVETLADHPMMNARFCDDAIEVYDNVDLSFAIALAGTLVVPVVHNAEKMSFAELARSMNSVTDRARTGHLSLGELQGGTITVNNTGANGSIMSKPIINGGQAAIVTMEAIVKRPVVVADDAIAVRSMLNICCTIDHRVIDGDVVGAFLRDLKARLAGIE